MTATIALLSTWASASAIACVSTLAPLVTASSSFSSFCADLPLVHLLLVLNAVASTLTLLFIYITRVLLAGAPFSADETAAAQSRLFAIGSWRAVLVLAVIKPHSLAELLLFMVFYASVAVVSVLVHLLKSRWEAITASDDRNIAIPAISRRYRFALYMCGMFSLGLSSVAFCMFPDVWSPVVASVILLVDPATLLLHTAHVLAHVAIALKDASMQGGWDARLDAIAQADFGFLSLALTCLLIHFLLVWSVRGFTAGGVVDWIILSQVLSTATQLRLRWSSYWNFLRISRSVEGSFKTATQADLVVPESPRAADGDTQTRATCYRDCSICLEAMRADGDRGSHVKLIPDCGHAFHWRCLRRWLIDGHDTCPLCRRKISGRQAGPVTAQQQERGLAAVAQEGPAAVALQQQQQRGVVVGAIDWVIRRLRLWQDLAPAIVRAGGPEEAAALAQLTDMFPQLHIEDLRRHLLEIARGDVWATVNAAMIGSIPARAVVAATNSPPVVAGDAISEGVAAPASAAAMVAAPLPLEEPEAASLEMTASALPAPSGAGSWQSLRRQQQPQEPPFFVAPSSHPTGSSGGGVGTGARSADLDHATGAAARAAETPAEARAKRLAAIDRRLSRQ
jgi:hypothetical protein